MKAKAQKIGLSPDLESRFFHRRLDRKSIEALRRQCESYQEGQAPNWKPGLIWPYSCYFGFLTALKTKSALNELIRFGYSRVWNEPVKIIDFGAGSLGATLGAMDSFRENEIVAEGLLAIDRDPRASLWGFKEFSDLLPEKRSIKKTLAKLELYRPCLFMFSNVLVEVFARKDKELLSEILSLIKSANDKTVFLFVEPAHFDFNQKFLNFRNQASEVSHILLPCSHQNTCPALEDNEWCHEERAYRAPSTFWNFVSDLGFRKQSLNFSLLALGKQPSIFRASDARVVSQALESKGVSNRWLCSEKGRWKESLLQRNRNEQNEAFFDSLRGDILEIEPDPQSFKALSTADSRTA